ncbi:TonB-dependent receptor [Aestuariibacter sp. AA17]|uniref:TonB-dependent receptor n=1 Tax=Fluctibacter corallii TaxID=2984329 RepID=A0ABT3AAT7_9ALTE|nr:TonB-dependent receptor plug domain-containing protein [Aestuariibacter sp. AA17]MCV2885729.1 TonB-dependent receptor [Aestuariibacter sp. AA17]
MKNTHTISQISKMSLLGASISLALSGHAFAQDAAEEDNNSNIEAITVTATKRSQVIYEVPIAISAFNGEALAAQGVTDLTDVGKFVPNLNVTGFSAGHTSSANPFIRGIGLQDHLITTDPGVSVYVDGVYLGRQVGQNWNLNNIERIEVLRGPQGTLYGRNSIGGAINIITKQPDEVAVTKLNVEAGTRGRKKADIFLNREITPELAFNLNAGYNARDGIGEFINVPDAEYDVGETKELYGRLSVRYAPSDDFSLVLTADKNDGEGGLRPYQVLIDEVPTGAYYTGGRFGGTFENGPLRNADTTADPYDNATGSRDVTTVTNEASGISLTADWNWNDDFASKVVVSSRSSEYKAGLDDDGTVYTIDQFPELGEADQTSVEFQINGFLGDADFVSGLYWFEEEGSNYQMPGTAGSTDGAFFNEGPTLLALDQETTSKAVFINVGYDVSDALRVSGGLRYTKDEKEASADIWIDGEDGPTDATKPQFASDKWDEVSFDLSANYTFDSGINVYGSIQNGYQSGQFPARPYCMFTSRSCFVATENITAVNYELGVKGEVTDNFSMSVAVFNTEFEDLPYQVSTTAVGGFNTVNLVVEQTSRGVEFEGTLTLTDNFKVHTSLGYMDVDVDEKDGVKPVAPLTPDLTASISPMFEYPLASGATIKARVDYSFRDEMYGEPTSDAGRQTLLDSRELVNFDISYVAASEDWTVSLYGRNVFDERYDNARLNTGDYILQILSNDASEFGLRYRRDF